VDKIRQKYQNEIEAIISKALSQGIKGWEVSDIRITLVDGQDHEIHSRPGDFMIATPMALMNGLQKVGTSLLEPILSFTIKAPETLLGKISGDLHKMRGQFDSPLFEGDFFVLTGTVPAATSLDYAIELASLSGGKAHIRFAFSHYAPVSDELGLIRAYRGVNPLNRERWILHKRGAYKADDRG
jgi:ribosomal protection tetracycline resistance protein